MLIIIEGPDNVGKTTQIRKIKNHYALTKNVYFILHSSSNYETNNDISHMDLASKEYKYVFQYSKQMNILSDRLHGGEVVYAPIYRNYDGDYVYTLELNNNIDKREDIYLIVLVDKAKNLIDRDDGKSFSIDIDKKELEISKFKEFYEKTNIKNKILIDIENKDEDKVFNEIIKFLKIQN